MTIAKLVVMLVCLMSVPLETKEAKVTPLFSKDLTDFPGKEGLMITVEYPPGSSDPSSTNSAGRTMTGPDALIGVRDFALPHPSHDGRNI
jgi:hypothetical protein